MPTMCQSHCVSREHRPPEATPTFQGLSSKGRQARWEEAGSVAGAQGIRARTPWRVRDGFLEQTTLELHLTT